MQEALLVLIIAILVIPMIASLFNYSLGRLVIKYDQNIIVKGIITGLLGSLWIDYITSHLTIVNIGLTIDQAILYFTLFCWVFYCYLFMNPLKE